MCSITRWNLLSFLLLLPWGMQAQPTLALETFASGFTSPVDIAHAGDDRLFVVEKAGVIKVVSADGAIQATPFLDIRDRVNAAESERGLLGLVFHPSYASNGFFYVNYTDSNGHTRISRFSRNAADAGRADPNSERILLGVEQPRANHNGGDLAFGPDGYLYVALGDGGGSGDPNDNAQTGQSLLGKMLRIDVNTGAPYAIPPNNPFINDANVRDEIWALGLRNPWRFSFDRQTGDLWIADVGQGAWEEVNFRSANSPGGTNYGWRCYEGLAPYNLNGCPTGAQYTVPVHVYAHRSGNCGASVTGGFVYRGRRHPDLVGHYVYADYCTGKISSITSDGNGGWTNNDLLNWEERQIVSFGENTNGELFLTAIRQGVVYQLRTTVSNQNEALLGLTEVRLSPNPFRQSLRLSGRNDRTGDYEILLYDIQGRLVLRQVEPLPSSFSKEFNLNGLAPGIYLLQIKKDEHSQTWRVVKE